MYSEKDSIALLRKVVKKTDSPIAKKALKERDCEMERSLAHQLLSETFEEYAEGEMDWKEAMDDLHKNLLAIEVKKKD